MKKYEYYIAGCAFDFAPVQTHVAMLSCSESDALMVPECILYKGPWGFNNQVELLEEPLHQLPQGIHLIYLSVIEKKFYLVNDSLPQDVLYEMWEQVTEENEPVYNKIMIGMAPFGLVAVWAQGTKKSNLIFWEQGSVVDVEMDCFLPASPGITVERYCEYCIGNDIDVNSFIMKNGFPTHAMIDNYMKQYRYRFQVRFCHWNEGKNEWVDYYDDEVVPRTAFIEESLFDGTYDKLHDESRMEYHSAGVPEKVMIRFDVGQSEFAVFFWFDEKCVITAFEDFFRSFPDRSMSFVFSVDCQKNVYQIAMEDGVTEHIRGLRESTYQQIVFKNDLEYFRSSNYNKPQGAWIW